MRPPRVIQSAVDAISAAIDELEREGGRLEREGTARAARRCWRKADDLRLPRDALLWALGGDRVERPILAPFLGQSSEEPDLGEPDASVN